MAFGVDARRLARETGLEPATARLEDMLSPVGLFPPVIREIPARQVVAGFVWQPMPDQLIMGALR